MNFDIVILGIFIPLIISTILMFTTGYFTYPRSLAEFIKPKTNISTIAIIASIVATSIGSASTIGFIEKIINNRFEYIVAFFISLLWLIIIAKYFVDKIIKFRDANTIADIFEQHYGKFGKAMIGGFSAIFSLGHLSAQILACGYIFELINIPPIYGIMISYIIIIGYSTLGGTEAVIKTDLIQLLVIIIGLICIFCLGYFCILETKVNNYLLYHNITERLFTAQSKEFFNYNSFSLSITFMIMTFYPSFIQRLLLNKNSSVLRKILHRAVLCYVTIFALTFFVGIYFSQIVHYDEGQKNIFILIYKNMPQILQIIISLTLIAALFSTADSDLNSATISIYYDIFQSLFPKYYANGSLRVAQVCSISIGAIAIIIARYFNDLLDLIIFMNSFWAPVIFAPFIAILYAKPLNKLGLIINITIGITISSLWSFFYNGPIIIYGTLIGCISSCISYIIIYQLLQLWQKFSNTRSQIKRLLKI